MARSIAVTAVLCGSVLISCSDPERGASSEEPARLLLVGIDGFEWDVVLELIEQGRLPILRELVEDGLAGTLETTRPTISPTIWTSIATGQSADKHGISGFTRRGENGEKVLYTSADRLVPALWNILSAHGKRTICLGWWNSFPVEPIEGIEVAQVNVRGQSAKGGVLAGVAGQVHPPEREAGVLELAARIEESMPEVLEEIFGGTPRVVGEVAERLWSKSQWSLRADATYARLATRLLREREPFDLFMVYFGAADVLGHRFWRYAYPDEFENKPSAEEVAAMGDLLRLYYVHLDRVLGELLELAPQGCNLIVVSDHGMRAWNRSGTFDASLELRKLNSGHHNDAPPAFFLATGPGIARDAAGGIPSSRETLPSRGSILDVTPTVLTLLGLPIGRDMDGQLPPGLLVSDLTPTFIDSHNTAAWTERVRDPVMRTAADEERIDQLRGLGYVE